VHLKSFVKRNAVEGSLVFAGVVILVIQFAVAKYYLSHSGIDHTNIIGAPLDDVYIHCRYAENLLAGKGYSFNPGHIVSADTSPLWVVLIAFGGLITSHLDLIAIILSSIAWLLLAPGVYRVARYVFVFEQSFSIAAGILMLLSPRLLAMALSGMETTFAALLVLIAVEMHIKSREIVQIRMREATVLGLGIAIRPEFYFLVVIASLDWLYLIFKKKQISIKEIIGYSIPLLVSGYFVFSIPLSERGNFIYHSSIIQGVGFRFPPDFYYIAKAFFILLESSWWIILLLLLNIFSFSVPRLKGSNTVLVLFIILLPVAQGFIAPQYRHFGRYIFPVLPLVVLSMIALLRQNINSGKQFAFFRTWKDRKKIILLSSITVIASLPLAIRWTSLYAESVRNINDQHLAVASWINTNVPDEDKLAVDDVGAAGYFTERNVIDLTGLVSPEFLPLQRNQSLVWKEARRQGANLFIIYTRLNPAFYQYAKDSLELIKEFRIRPPLVSSADTVMSVFKAKGDSRAAR
jgi:hypothetical protein